MKYTRDIIAVIIILAAAVSLFITVNETGEELIRYLAILIVGFFFGAKEIPIATAFKEGKKK